MVNLFISYAYTPLVTTHNIVVPYTQIADSWINESLQRPAIVPGTKIEINEFESLAKEVQFYCLCCK
jgi:hypothetical protein